MRILAMAGSTRKDSYNRKLLHLVSEALQAQGAHVLVVDLKEYSLPFYDGDMEQSQGLPAKASELKELQRGHDLLLIATPEYNGFFPALLKNTLDWMSRAVGDEQARAVFLDKPAAIISASPGGYAGQRAQGTLRTQMGNLGCKVREETVALGKAHEVFDGGASPTPELLEQVKNFAAALLQPLAAV